MTPKQIAEKWFDELWNKRSSEFIYEASSPELVAHFETIEKNGVFEEKRGHAAMVEFHRQILALFPVLNVKILNSLGDEDDACLLWEADAIPAGSASPIKFRGVTWFHLKNGKIVEGWDAWNEGGVKNVLAGI